MYDPAMTLTEARRVVERSTGDQFANQWQRDVSTLAKQFSWSNETWIDELDSISQAAVLNRPELAKVTALRALKAAQKDRGDLPTYMTQLQRILSAL